MAKAVSRIPLILIVFAQTSIVHTQNKAPTPYGPLRKLSHENEPAHHLLHFPCILHFPIANQVIAIYTVQLKGP